MERNADIQIPKSSRRSLEKTEVNLPEMKIYPHKLPPLLGKGKDVNYDNSYASFQSLLWKTQRQICSSNQSVSHRYVGWISSTYKAKNQPKTSITFLPPIHNPITQFSPVIECIYQSQKLAESCNMKYAHVTADAGAACKFYQVVWNNQEKFENVIIHLGDFHAMQEMFVIIGKIVAGSGFEDVLYQADLCTSGGIKDVLSGKHYNRSWNVHECFSESLHRLFFERESESLTISPDLEEMIKNVNDASSCQRLLDHADFKDFSKKFDVLLGQDGSILDFLNSNFLVQELHYSININDFHLRMKCWRDLVILCFPTNKRNYARYGSYYVEQMQNLPTTHPGAVEELLEKGISVSRNDIGIGQSIDGAGEQTFRRSAKTRGGIKSFTSNDATYSKWVLSRPFQAKFVEALLDMIGKGETGRHSKCLRKFVEALLDMIGKGETGSHSKCLRKSEISRSEQRIVNMKDILTNTFLNPFSFDLDDDKLFNIASGCPIPDEASNCLLGIRDRGQVLYSSFRPRLSVGNGEIFCDPIKVQEWKDFTISNRTSKAQTSKGKTIEVKVQRDILGFLLAKSQKLNSTIDLEEALKYPLSPVPLAIAHGDGQTRKTNKSTLLNYIPPPSAAINFNNSKP